jgi:hypothetical protein
MSAQPHSFHIPVMGTGFTIDTPLKVARYGISSVISLVDDVLIEQVRRYYHERIGEAFVGIRDGDEDCRARRITAYLNLVDRLVRRQTQELQRAFFEEGSEITRYFRLLPETPLKRAYNEMLAETDAGRKAFMQAQLRSQAAPGSIDVNIMTKLDRDAYSGGCKLPPEFADAMSALRGYANSTLNSGIVFSAGINQRLYRYAANFEDFFPDGNGRCRKNVILKVSDFRSAEIQGKFLAKCGLWVAEFRIESGLNCGGHAFATDGHLLGPVLDEFKQKRGALLDTLRGIYVKALGGLGRSTDGLPAGFRVTVQGGIGTASENDFLMEYYRLDGTGWGTPFLLVPEATNVDPAQLQKLLGVRPGDVYLSDCSPLGVPFWNLRTSASEESRRLRNRSGKPGSPCPKGFAALSREFSEVPLCLSSRAYIHLKLKHLPEEGLTEEQLALTRAGLLEKSCLCHDLAGGVALNYNLHPDATPAVCCGPNIVSFSKLATIEEMVGHIYGRLSLISDSDRPHMLIQELKLYIEHLQNEAKKCAEGISRRPQAYFKAFKDNLQAGVDYYRSMARQFIGDQRERFLSDLECLQAEIQQLLASRPVPVPAECAMRFSFSK